MTRLFWPGRHLKHGSVGRVNSAVLATKVSAGRQHRAALQHSVETFLVHLEGVENHVDAGAGRGQHRLASAGVGDHLAPQAVALLDHRVHLALVEAGHQLAVRILAVQPVERDLDEIHPVLDLHADLFDRLVGVAHQHADRALGDADPGRIPVRESLARGDLPPGGGDARPVEHAGVDRIADADRRPPGRGRVGDRGIARLHHSLRRAERAQRPVFRRGEDVDVLVRLGVAVAQMDVDVDQPRHDEVAAVVDHRLARPLVRRFRGRAHIGDPVVVDDDRPVGLRGLVEPVEQRPADQVLAHVFLRTRRLALRSVWRSGC